MNLAQEHAKLADDLDFVAATLQKYARCLRGQEIDLTGVGLQRIAIQNLELALGVKVLARHQWDWFVQEQEKMEERKEWGL